MFKDDLKLRLLQTGLTFCTFEHACFTNICKSMYYFAVYRPPPSAMNGLKTSHFLEEFDKFIDFVNTLSSKVIIVGDFNVHVDNPSKGDASHFLTTLANSGLDQHVTGPTHKSGHTLDLVISRPDDNLISNCTIDSLLSDHHVVYCSIQLPKPNYQKVKFFSRKLGSVDLQSFQDDLAPLLDSNSNNVNDLVELYNNAVKQTLDKHAPVTMRSRTNRPHQPWYTSEIHVARRLRRKYERMWRKSKLEVHRGLYVDQRKVVNDLLDSLKVEHYRSEFEYADSKTIFKKVKSLLNQGATVLPDHTSAQDLSNSFATFFTDKVDNIYRSIEEELQEVNYIDPAPQNLAKCCFHEFERVSEK